jgi:hypothetical protein
MPPTPSFVKEITVTIRNLLGTTLDLAHQADATRRDRAFEENVRSGKIQILKRAQATSTDSAIVAACTTCQEAPTIRTEPTPVLTVCQTQRPALTTRHTERIDQQDRLQKMERELRMWETPVKLVLVRKLSVTARKDLPRVDIYCIGAVGFHRNLKQAGTIAFSTSLYEIDRLLEEKQLLTDQDQTDEQLIDSKLPARYHEFKDVFSRTASNTLPLHRPYDHEIKLEGEQELALSYSPLR